MRGEAAEFVPGANVSALLSELEKAQATDVASQLEGSDKVLVASVLSADASEFVPVALQSSQIGAQEQERYSSTYTALDSLLDEHAHYRECLTSRHFTVCGSHPLRLAFLPNGAALTEDGYCAVDLICEEKQKLKF